MTVTIDNHLPAGAMRRALEADVTAGLAARPRTLPPRWFYDARGSDLFDRITRLPEYYPTRCERAVLEARSADIAAISGADTLVELGSGTSEKTRLLLSALSSAGSLRRFVPFDVDGSVLGTAAEAVAQEYGQVDVHAVVGDFEQHLGRLPRGGRRLVAFLGGTVGNLLPGPRAAFLLELAGTLQRGDTLLLGTDLVKAPGRLLPAYDDAAGVTAEFNRNVLLVVNRELGADFDPKAFRHVAVWDDRAEWVEMRLQSLRDQTVRIPAVDLVVDLPAGEWIRTEVSAKFRREGLTAELAAAGLRMQHWWTDPQGEFAVSLSGPA